jgi:23S rRNA (adenine-N6)-dimethyltransferase
VFPTRPSRHGGRHELGQNFLVDRPSIRRFVDVVRRTHGPILEIGAGDGALTSALAGIGRDVLAVELDERRARDVRRRVPEATVIVGDALRVPIDRPVVAGNVPFHLTTPILRRLLREPHWGDAVLVVQWEVARKRAGVGGGTVMTAQAGPWFEFSLHGRVPADAFHPVPSVDAGIMSVRRRATPLVDSRDRPRYELFVRNVFSGRGRGLLGVLTRAIGMPPASAVAVLDAAGLRSDALPRDVTPEQWAALWEAQSETTHRAAISVRRVRRARRR